jgi:hypothetical protein
MTRWKAASIHLAISIAIAGTVLGAMLAVWYPQPFFEAAGGSRLLFILVGVDVVLGPTITLLIFDVKKKTLAALKFDLAVIATVQLAALLYGIYVVFQARPVYVVFVKDRFELATAADIDRDELAKVTRPEFRDLPLSGPRVVGALGPTDATERERILFASILGGTDLHSFPQHYVPYEQVATEVAARGLTLAKAREVEPDAAAAIADYLARSGRDEADVRYLPLRARQTWLAAVVNAKSGAVIAFLPVKIQPK